MIKPQLSIVIVKYNSDQYLPALLSSIGIDLRWETIIVDNDKENIGYGPACNRGAAKAKGELLLFLNADTLVFKDTLSSMIDYLLTHPDIAVLGPKLYLDKSKSQTQLSCCRFPSPLTAILVFSPLKKLFPDNYIWNRYVYKKQLAHGLPFPVEAVSGAALLIRRKIFTSIGGFDPKIFFYFEENDLCKRVIQNGYQIVYHPGITMIHYGGGSTVYGQKLNIIFSDSRRYFFGKHYSPAVRCYTLTVFSLLDALISIKNKLIKC